METAVMNPHDTPALRIKTQLSAISRLRLSSPIITTQHQTEFIHISNMKASTILSLAAATLVSAAPADGDAPVAKPKELTRVTDFFLQKTLDEKVTHVSFRLSGRDADNVLCTANNVPFPKRDIHVCGGSMYSFVLRPGTDGAEYGLALSHGLAIGYVCPLPCFSKRMQSFFLLIFVCCILD